MPKPKKTKKPKKKKDPCYTRACGIKHSITTKKLRDIRLVTKEYRKTANLLQMAQWKLFFSEGKFNKMADVDGILFNLEPEKYQRYKQTAQYQIVGQLKSHVSNRANEFKSYVHKSSLEKLTKQMLFKINKRKIWFSPELEQEYGLGITKLARTIYKRCLSKTKNGKKANRPSFKRCNMVLDAKVCQILDKDETKATSFHNWLKFSTLELGKPICLPLEFNHYFEYDVLGTRNNSVQFNWNNNELSIYLTKKKKKPEKRKGSKKLGLDLGLRTLFASNLGDLVGRRFIDRLYYFDEIITNLSRDLQKQKIKLSENLRYKRLINRCRESLLNEVRRCLNRLVEIHNPDEIVVEKLNFKNSKLSRRMNRLLSKFGKSGITKKLDAISEELGIKITYVNPAYTSQTCPNTDCGYVAKNNRNNETFHCKMCGFISHADVVGACNINSRSSWKEPLYRSKKYILNFLKKKFLENVERFPPEHLRKILSKNPYFKDFMKVLDAKDSRKTTPSSRLLANNYRPKGFHSRDFYVVL